MMKKEIKEILYQFDNSYGGDITIIDSLGQKRYLHLSYDEVVSLISKLRKKDVFSVVKHDGAFKIIKQHKLQKKSKKEIYSFDGAALVTLLKNAIRPNDVSKRVTKIECSFMSNSDQYEQSYSKPKPTKKALEKKVRFDWHDHYLEGLRIHGNHDDAESHADDMKRKLTGRY